MNRSGVRPVFFAFLGLLLLASLGISACGEEDPESDAVASERSAATKGKNLPDDYYVLEAAYRYLFDCPDAVQDDRVSAHVLARGPFKKELVEAFDGHTPPVIESSEATDSTGHESMGKFHLSWGAQIMGIQGNRAHVTAYFCFRDDVPPPRYTVHLLKSDGTWKVESAKCTVPIGF